MSRTQGIGKAAGGIENLIGGACGCDDLLNGTTEPVDVFSYHYYGGFSKETKGVIFYNTLAASDYAFLERIVFNPRPNYFAVLLWNLCIVRKR